MYNCFICLQFSVLFVYSSVCCLFAVQCIGTDGRCNGTNMCINASFVYSSVYCLVTVQCIVCLQFSVLGLMFDAMGQTRV